MTYSILIERSAKKSLERLAKADQTKVLERIEALAENPRPPGCKKLQGRPAWRIRSGSYRILYEIHDDRLVVLVVALGHRRQIYRRR